MKPTQHKSGVIKVGKNLVTAKIQYPEHSQTQQRLQYEREYKNFYQAYLKDRKAVRGVLAKGSSKPAQFARNHSPVF